MRPIHVYNNVKISLVLKPFSFLYSIRDWISGDINVSRGAVTDFVDKCIDNSETSLKYLRHVIFIESYGDSLKVSILSI